MEEVEIDLRHLKIYKMITSNMRWKAFRTMRLLNALKEEERRLWEGSLKKKMDRCVGEEIKRPKLSTQHASHIAIESPQTFAQRMRGPIVGNYDSSQGITSMNQLL
ncbi:hypothetical protein QJS10_CPA05g01771 [Acorus calamus]|uniref:Uncharacterized protein n=1 Tax=Acorus calamus TaxID=4465 RepID=A0AAV9EVR2_ACOCL|nr:hypothetical protein QJS10_CPA05g01771 [Acorus calamus]